MCEREREMIQLETCVMTARSKGIGGQNCPQNTLNSLALRNLNYSLMFQACPI